MMAGMLRALVPLALVSVLVAATVIGVWHFAGARPDERDLVLYLGVLPLATAIALLMAWRWQRTRARRRADAAIVPTSPSLPMEAPAAATMLPDAPVDLLAAAVMLPIGGDAESAALALAQSRRPGLHPQLRDAQGFPVLAAFVPDLDTEAAADALGSPSRVQADASGMPADTAILRALALLEPVADALLLRAYAPDTAAAIWQDPTTPYGNAHLLSAAKAAPMLRVRLLLPAAWPQPARQAATQWLVERARMLGHAADAFTVESLPLADGMETWRLIERLTATIAAEPHDERHLLLATHSGIDARSIAALSLQGALFDSRHPQASIPGEGAAGALLAARTDPAEAPVLRLHRCVHAAHADGTRSRDAVLRTGELIQRALDTAAQPADRVRALVSDADHRATPATHIAAATAAVFPDLEPLHDCLPLGVSCGDTGIAAPLIALAMAHARALRDDAPAMVIGTDGRSARVALVVSPAAVRDDVAAGQLHPQGTQQNHRDAMTS